MNQLTEPVYVVGFEELLWGGSLLALTMAIHGLGMLMVLRVANTLHRRFAPKPSFAKGLVTLILATWLIMLAHLLEVVPWAVFFAAVGAVNTAHGNTSIAFYVALSDYTTLGCEFTLVQHWRLLQGMIAVAGLMTFAWSTGVLLTIAQTFQDQQLKLLQERRARRKSQQA
ncbi:MAG TPA: hypothetical protein VFY71_07245 [Planctomycetota bacterium]|nr:hypothetical protein [Planctomycetota bacterium]